MQIKPTATLLTIILLLTTTTGCTLLHHTTFTLLTSTITDTNGFPALTITFNLSDYATLLLTDPTGHTLTTTDFYQGTHTTTLALAPYRTTPTQGTYTLTATDTQHTKIATQKFRYTTPHLNLTACNQTWFHQTNETILLLNLTITNTGDLPFYPHAITVSLGTLNTTGPTPPTTILPQSTSYVTSTLLMPRTLTTHQMTVNLLDNQGMTAETISTNISTADSTTLTYSWYYRGHHTLTLPNATALYFYDRSLPREPTEDYALYVFNPLDDQYLTYLVHRLTALAATTDQIERLNFIANFVQSLDYREDDPLNASVEYPRYPIETLNEHGGDCEDKAILCAQLLTLAGYNASLLRLPNHMAVGVHLDNLTGYTPFADGYYYLEATAGFSPVGRIPGDYQGETNFTFYPLYPRPLVFHEWLNATHYQSTSENYVRITVLVRNLGALQTPVDVRAFFSANSLQYDMQHVLFSSLTAGDAIQASLRIDVPKSVTSLLKTQIVVNGIVVDEKESSTFFD